MNKKPGELWVVKFIDGLPGKFSDSHGMRTDDLKKARRFYYKKDARYHADTEWIEGITHVLRVKETS